MLVCFNTKVFLGLKIELDTGEKEICKGKDLVHLLRSAQNIRTRKSPFSSFSCFDFFYKFVVCLKSKIELDMGEKGKRKDLAHLLFSAQNIRA